MAMHAVWVTRSEPGASRLTRLLREQGFEVLCQPLVRIRRMVPWTVQVNGEPNGSHDAALRPPPSLVCALSAHAVEAFARGGLGSYVARAQFVAVGRQTASAVRGLGLEVEVPQHQTSEGLLAMAEVRALRPGDTVWILAGRGGRDVLERKLVNAGCFRVVKFELYERVSVARVDDVEADRLAAVELSSVQALDTFSRYWQRMTDASAPTLIVPSQRVAEEARARGFARIHNAMGAAPEAVAAAVRTVMGDANEEN